LDKSVVVEDYDVNNYKSKKKLPVHLF